MILEPLSKNKQNNQSIQKHPAESEKIPVLSPVQKIGCIEVPDVAQRCHHAPRDLVHRIKRHLPSFPGSDLFNFVHLECVLNLRKDATFVEYIFCCILNARQLTAVFAAFNGKTTTRVGAAIWEYGNILSKVNTKEPATKGLAIA